MLDDYIVFSSSIPPCWTNLPKGIARSSTISEVDKPFVSTWEEVVCITSCVPDSLLCS
jgi:hypothetical protein